MKCGTCGLIRNPQVHKKEWDYIDGKFVCSDCVALKKLFNPIVPKALEDFKLEPLTIQSSKVTCATCRGDASNGIQNPLNNHGNFCSKHCFDKCLSVFMKDSDQLTLGLLPDHDPVNNPKHYTTHPSGVKCIQITRHMNFNRGNAVKYIWRCGDKGKPIEDLQKAVWYLQDEIKRLEDENSKDNA